ncbi:MAG: hypothetical protein AAF533_06615 [Acidobacteriota bacterium]
MDEHGHLGVGGWTLEAVWTELGRRGGAGPARNEAMVCRATLLQRDEDAWLIGLAFPDEDAKGDLRLEVTETVRD